MLAAACGGGTSKTSPPASPEFVETVSPASVATPTPSDTIPPGVIGVTKEFGRSTPPSTVAITDAWTIYGATGEVRLVVRFHVKAAPEGPGADIFCVEVEDNQGRIWKYGTTWEGPSEIVAGAETDWDCAWSVPEDSVISRITIEFNGRTDVDFDLPDLPVHALPFRES